MATFVNFNSLVAKAKGDINAVVKRFTFGIFARVIMRTPVDTGRARGAWALGVGAITIGPTNFFDKGPVTPNGSGTSGAKSAMQEALNGDSWIGKIVYLTNSLAYVYFLEYGRMFKSGYRAGSQQAPYGMVRITVNEYATVFGESLPFKLGAS